MKKRWVVHCKAEKYDVYIGRPSEWGNPFSYLPNTLAKYRVATREEAIAKYREWLLSNSAMTAKLPELKGKILGCFCYPLPCHGNVLAELANKEDDNLPKKI